MSGPWGGVIYRIAHDTLTVSQVPSIREENRAVQEVFHTLLPHDAAFKQLTNLDPTTYEGVPHDMLEGGAVLRVELHKGDAQKRVLYQSGTYARADAVTTFLLTYINAHVPPALAISQSWLVNEQVFQPRTQ